MMAKRFCVVDFPERACSARQRSSPAIRAGVESARARSSADELQLTSDRPPHGFLHPRTSSKTRYNIIQLPVHPPRTSATAEREEESTKTRIMISAPMECWICMLRSGVRRED
jgi:hypothetical protein